MRFLAEAQRELLENLGITVVDEREERQAVDPPYYELLVEFGSPAIRSGFLSYPNPVSWGLSSVEEVRASGGSIDERRLMLRFSNLERARAFQQPDHAGCPIPLTVKGKEQKVSAATFNVLTVQFQDQQAIDRFYAELAARRDGDTATLALTANQRADLFDALDAIDRRGPDDRRGDRLAVAGIPQEAEFALDVDLWHPGSAQLLNPAIDDFHSTVGATGGRVTGRVRSVMQTLLISRVRGNRATLDALLNYDRVARVDLPPRLEPVRFTIFNATPVQTDTVNLPEDGPLACVVDSGVVPGHPLLRDLVVESQDFGSGEDTPFDRVGHGTHVAGIVAFGDTWEQLQSGGPWVPKVRLLNAKVLRRMEEGFDGEIVRPGFSDLERAEAQIEDAIRRFAEDADRRCRVFNLSLGNEALRVSGGHQHPWALLLDQLARELDIAIVVSAGNASPAIPSAPTEADIRASVRERLFTEDHALIDPACAVNVLTVGAISRREVPEAPAGGRPDPVGSPCDCPAPFTRTGMLASNGSGPCRAVKPELVGYGGNLSLLPHGAWRDNDPLLGEPSLNYDFTTRLLSVKCGTSVAAPYATHVCALIEHRMRLLNEGRKVSANLIRALAAHGAVLPAAAVDWLGADQTDAQATRRILRTVGYGRPNPYRCCFSDNNRAVLYAEDELAEKCFHLYGFELPSEFLDMKGTRCIRVTLAYDPPVRGTRLEYLSRTMTLRLYRGLSTGRLQQVLAKSEGDIEAAELPASVQRLPSPTLVEWSTLQSLECRSRGIRSFQNPDDNESTRGIWHVLVACKHRFPTEETDQRQRYALVMSLEHSDDTVQVYQPLQVQVTERARARARVTGR
jgi:hypothetical protein